MIEEALNSIGVSGWLADSLSVVLILIVTFTLAHLAKALFAGIFARLSRMTATNLDYSIVRVTKPAIVNLVYLAGLQALSAHLDGKYEWYSGLRVEIVGAGRSSVYWLS